MEFLIFLLLLFCAFMAYKIWESQKSSNTCKNNQNKPYSSDELRIENVTGGGVIRLTGIGPDMEEFDLKVIAKHTYRQGESTWYELECDKGSEEKVWIDMEEDDSIELAVSLRKLKLRDIGITAEDLIRMDDNEDGSFTFEGVKYYMEDSDRAVFYRYNEDKNAEKFYYWDFESKDGKHFITVEKWSDGSYDVTYSEPIKLSQITVYNIK